MVNAGLGDRDDGEIAVLVRVRRGAEELAPLGRCVPSVPASPGDTAVGAVKTAPRANCPSSSTAPFRKLLGARSSVIPGRAGLVPGLVTIYMQKCREPEAMEWHGMTGRQ